MEDDYPKIFTGDDYMLPTVTKAIPFKKGGFCMASMLNPEDVLVHTESALSKIVKPPTKCHQNYTYSPTIT
jgi:hypothetical protein